MAEESRRPEGGAAGPGAGETGKVSVLVVEDDLISSKMVSIFLTRRGYAPACVGNGQEALDALGRQAFDLVLMDVQMPVMDGITAALQLRDGAAGELNRRVPIIAMTAYVLVEDEKQRIQAGMNGFAGKPLDLDQLAKLMEDLVSGRSDGKDGGPMVEVKAETVAPEEVLHRGKLLERYRGDKALVNELYKAFLEDGPAKVAQIKAARAEGNVEAAGRVAHSLKGVSGVIFANRTMQLAARMQESARIGDAEASWALADELEIAVDEVIQELKRDPGGK